MRLCLLVVVLYLASCAHQQVVSEAVTNDQVTWSGDHSYYTTIAVTGCPRWIHTYDASPDRPLILSFELQRQLATLLEAAEAKDARLKKRISEDAKTQACWYELPNGYVRLDLGDPCFHGTQLLFRRNDASWLLSRTVDWIAICE
jgi:hypothetical protein